MNSVDNVKREVNLGARENVIGIRLAASHRHASTTIIAMSPSRMTSPETPTPVRRIVLYDGLCGMCDAVVQFLLRHDSKRVFLFAAQQGQTAHKLLQRHGVDPAAAQTIFLIENYDSPQEEVLSKSDAALSIARALGGLWTLALVARLLPRSIRDACYDWIARNRYKFFGRRTACRIPDAEVQHRFIR